MADVVEVPLHVQKASMYVMSLRERAAKARSLSMRGTRP
jgi:hypothetical protein